MSNSLQIEIILVGPIYGICLNILPFYFILFLRIVFAHAINIAVDSADRKTLICPWRITPELTCKLHIL